MMSVGGNTGRGSRSPHEPGAFLPLSAPPAQLRLDEDPLRESEQEAKAAAENGMMKAWRAQRVAAWKETAAHWLEAHPVGVEFTADDLVHDVGLPDVGPSRNNVVGAWFSGQAKAGNIIFANRMRRSRRVVRHGNPQRVWRKA